MANCLSHRRLVLLLLAFFAAFPLTTAPYAWANWTYNIVDYLSNEADRFSPSFQDSISGTITTDGTFGPAVSAAAHIIGFTIQVNTASGDYRMSAPPGGSVFTPGLGTLDITPTLITLANNNGLELVGDLTWPADSDITLIWDRWGTPAYAGGLYHQSTNGQYAGFSAYPPPTTFGSIAYNDPWIIANGGKYVPTSSTWTVNVDGNWSTSGNWIGGVPNGPGVTAYFTGATPASVNVDNPVTVGRISFDAGTANTNYTLSGSYIMLDNTGGTGSGALIEVVSGNHTISSPVILGQDTTITGNGSLDLSGGISGNYTLTVQGAGIVLTANSVALDTLTIGPDSTLTIAAIPGGPLADSGSLDSVPEPAAWTMLLLAAAAAGLHYSRKRKNKGVGSLCS